MSFILPSSNHKARELMGDMASLAEILNPANAGKLPTTIEARNNARRTLEANDCAKRVVSVVLRGDDERWLMSFGRRGGARKEWNFGNGRIVR